MIIFSFYHILQILIIITRTEQIHKNEKIKFCSCYRNTKHLHFNGPNKSHIMVFTPKMKSKKSEKKNNGKNRFYT